MIARLFLGCLIVGSACLMVSTEATVAPARAADDLAVIDEEHSPASLLDWRKGSLPASAARRRLQQSTQQATDKTNQQLTKIINGKDATDGQFPWQVALIRSETSQSDPFSGFYCGGTLVNLKWVLTAAHCTYEGNLLGLILQSAEMAPNAIDVYLGSRNFEGGERIQVRRIVRQAYNPRTLDNDVALLELAAVPKNLKGLDVIKLLAPTDAEPTTTGKYAVAIGWGVTSSGSPSKNLQYVDLQFKATETCNGFYVDNLRQRAKASYKQRNLTDNEMEKAVNRRYPRTLSLITPNMICAGSGVQVADACFGDSGGPLVVNRGGGYAQAGIVSWGPSEGCAMTNLYGVFTRVSRYVDWIATQIAPR
jgi:secreted trypsin-like serine protease